MSTSSPVALVAAEGGVVSSSSIPDGPTRRRSFTPSQKLKYLSEYEIGMHTPADVHYGLADAIDRDRDAALDEARAAHPERFGSRAQSRPKILDREPAAWINQPPADELQLAA